MDCFASLAMTSSIDMYLRIGGAPLYVRIAGDGAPLLLLHGGGPGTSGEGWREVMELLAPHHRVIAPDYPGFGHSAIPGTAPGIGRLAELMLELMGTLCIDRAAFAGHSMGAIVGATVATRAPQRVSHLALVAPGGGTYGVQYESPGIAAIARAAQEPSEANVRAVVELMSARPELIDAEVNKRMKFLERPGIVEIQRQLAAARGDSKARAAEPPSALGDKVRGLDLPIALLWGEHERFNPGEIGPKIHAALPAQAGYHVIPGAGHNAQYDRPEIVAAILRGFLAR